MTTFLSTRHLPADSAKPADAFVHAPAVFSTEIAKGQRSNVSRSTISLQPHVEHDDCSAATLIGPGDATGTVQVSNPVHLRWSGGGGDDDLRFRVIYSVESGNGKDVELGVTRQRELIAELPTGLIKWRVVTLSDGDTCSSGSLKVTVAEACQAPTATASASNTNVVAGETVTLSAANSGSAATSILWYQGNTGDRSKPAGSGATVQTGALTASTSFWCEVTNACGTAQSAAVAINVCTPVVIATQPSSTTINEGSTATLSVGVTGTQPVNIQWFSGSTPVGSGATFTTAPLTQTTTFRAEATNACGTATSNSVTVTVSQACTPPSIATQPASTSILEGATATLSVGVSGTQPVVIQWFDGATLVGSGATFTTPALTQTTNYRIEATNACGTAAAAVTVDVQKHAGCDGDVHTPLAAAIAQARSAVPYEVGWPSLGAGISYEVEESSSSDFADARVFTTQATSLAFRHDVGKAEQFFYRVRGVRTCDGHLGDYSGVLRVVVVPNPQVSGAGPDLVAAHGTLSIITQTLHLDAQTLGGVGASFHISTSETWLSISPASGIVPADGVTFTLAVDPRDLPQGTSAASLQIGNGGALRTDDEGATRGVPVTISLVTPVRPAPRPSDDGVLVIPAIAHAPGANSQWQSDVRIAHTWPVAMRYELTLTTTATNGNTGLQTVVTVPAGQTLALDDLVGRWFGAGALGDGVTGMLLIRQADNAVVPGRTVATSRLYNKAANGSFGQFVAAVPLSKFVASGARGLSMTQLAQSDAFRTNFGIVEGSGNAARVKIEAFDQAGAKLFESMLDLMPGEHRQLGGYLAANNVTTANGRVSVSVVSPKGRAYAYASVVDNKTGDPSFIPAFSTSNATTHVIAGAADLETPTGRWQTDLRLFNTSDASVPATLEYYPQGSSTPTATRELTLQPGEVRAADDVLRDLFGQSATGGAIRVKSAIAGALVPTARTYHNRGDGTYGQFIRGVSSDEALALGEQPRMILNAEESPRFRTNVGLVEVNGADTNVEVTITLPGRRVASTVQVPLKANEYRQLNSMLRTMGMTDAYNATVSVRVTGGNGKVVAFGSVVDNVTQDPTYVIAE